MIFPDLNELIPKIGITNEEKKINMENQTTIDSISRKNIYIYDVSINSPNCFNFNIMLLYILR